MANPVVETSGTLTATGSGTEDTLATVSSPRNLCLVVDLTNLAGGDAVTIRVKRKVLSGGSVRVVYKETWAGAQTDPVVVSVPVPSPHQAVFTLALESATPRAFDWSIESL
ncbi:MAG TPA: hypothetical protein VIU40_13930 [Geobacteraceae bacterium]